MSETNQTNHEDDKHRRHKQRVESPEPHQQTFALDEVDLRSSSPGLFNQGADSDIMSHEPSSLLNRVSSLLSQRHILTYAQGQGIKVRPRQEYYLSPKGQQVGQQMQRRVKSTIQAKALSINDNVALERNADIVKDRADQQYHQPQKAIGNPIIQRFSFESRLQHHQIQTNNDFIFFKNQGDLYPNNKGDLLRATDVRHQETMAKALQYAASRYMVIGNLANRIKTADGGMTTAPNRRIRNQMYPFIYEISVPFGRGGQILTLQWQYANNATGYIIGQQVTGEGPSTMVGAPITSLTPGYATTFFSTHGDTGSTKLSELIEQNPLLSQKENAERLDARTKLAGEGARFNVVRDNIASISDKTIIYTEDKEYTYHVRFRSLWMNWAGLFQSAYGITNDELATKLKNPSLWLATYKPEKYRKGLLKTDGAIRV